VVVDQLGSRFHAPSEGVQTALALTLMLAFVLGVVSVGALYRAALRHCHPERARGLAADAVPGDDHARGADAPPFLALWLFVLLVRLAFARRRRA